MASQTFRIHSGRFEQVQAMVNRWNNKAKKQDKPSMSIDVEEGWELNPQGFFGDKVNVLTHYMVTFHGEIPTVKGWEFLAKVECEPGGNMIYNFGEAELPEKYRTEKPFCDHCQTRKVKKHSYIIKNEKTGELMQVGKTCLKDFIDEPLDEILRLFEFAKTVKDFEDDDDAMFSGFYAPSSYQVDYVASIAARMIKVHGFRRMGSDMPTADFMREFLIECGNRNLSESQRREIQEIRDDIKKNYKKIGEEFVKHYKGLSGTLNEFQHNIQVLVNREWIEFEFFGFIAGAMFSFMADMQKKQAENIQFGKVLNQYYGKPKDKIELELSLEKVLTFPGYYGTSYFHIFRDSDGRTFVWSASHDHELKVGDKYTVKGSIKAHRLYQDVKQTVLTRCKVS